MPIDETLNRARAELAAGNVAAARNRTRGLVGSFPRAIAAREVLAETYRRTGDLAQAGRWAYATETVTDEEATAFAHAYRNDPVLMMRALRWSDSDKAASLTLVTHLASHTRLVRRRCVRAEPVSFDHHHSPGAVRRVRIPSTCGEPSVATVRCRGRPRRHGSKSLGSGSFTRLNRPWPSQLKTRL